MTIADDMADRCLDSTKARAIRALADVRQTHLSARWWT